MTNPFTWISPPARGDVDLEVLVVLADRVVGAAVVDAGVGHNDVLDGEANRELVGWGRIQWNGEMWIDISAVQLD